jgi:hypothetical protein
MGLKAAKPEALRAYHQAEIEKCDARPMALPALDNSSRYPQVVYDWFTDVGV